jgi:adenylate cyclase
LPNESPRFETGDADFEALGLLDGLEGDARRDRAELIMWLLNRGFSIDHIRASSAAPMLLPANRAMGDDGIYVSAREVCEATGIDLEVCCACNAPSAYRG